MRIGAVAVDFTYPYEDSLALQINVGDSQFVRERHCVKMLD